jgi:arylsulfatase A-like enzyme
VTAHGWLIINHSGWRSIRGDLSFALEMGIICILYVLLDRQIVRGTVRFALGGFVACGATVILVDGYLRSLTSISIVAGLQDALDAGNALKTLEEAGIGLRHLVLWIAIIGGSFLLGGTLQRVETRKAWPPRYLSALWVALLLGLVVFTTEQLVSRHRILEYPYRQQVYPGYVNLFSFSVGFPVACEQSPPPDADTREKLLEQVGPARNPRNVLFVLLESVKAGSMDARITPQLEELSRTGLDFQNAYAEGLYTRFSWNVLWLDRPAWSFSEDVKQAETDQIGSWPLAILHKAGYSIGLSMGARLRWKGYYPRIFGDGSRVARYFNPYTSDRECMENESPYARCDTLVTDQAAAWVRDADQNQPFFLMLMLNATHWPFVFTETDVVVRPYFEDADFDNCIMTRTCPPTNIEMIERLHSRFQNSLHYVDRSISRVVGALKETGLYDNTAIIIVSDHGHGFGLGRVGHATTHPEITRIPLIMRLPAVESRTRYDVIAQRDIFPTLFDYLDIEGVSEKMMLGHSALDEPTSQRSALTYGQYECALRMGDKVVQLKHHATRNIHYFRAIRVEDPEGRSVRNQAHALADRDWQEAFSQLANCTTDNQLR